MQFERERLGEPDHRMFRCRVGRHVRCGRDASQRSNVDDLALAARGPHRRQEGLDAVDDAEDVDVQRPSPPVDPGFLERAQVGNAGVVDQDVERPDGTVRGSRERSHRTCICNVTGMRDAADPHRADLALEFSQWRSIEVADHDVGALPGERTCTFEPDARGGPRDQRRLAAQRLHAAGPK